MNDRGKLGKFLKEVIHWNWAEFCVAEKDDKYTGLEATVFSLIRTASDGKLSAIKLAIDRVDGKLETPVDVIYPKVYYLYPEAKHLAPRPDNAPLPSGMDADLSSLNDEPEATPEVEVEEPAKIASMTLRETLEKLANHPQGVTRMILDRKKEVEYDPEAFLVNDSELNVPLVKSVIAANLLNLALTGRNKFDAISEVFDQIDGKLVEVFHVLGEDIYLVNYSETAPYNAIQNKDGVYQLEAPMVSQVWEQKLGANGKKR